MPPVTPPAALGTGCDNFGGRPRRGWRLATVTEGAAAEPRLRLRGCAAAGTGGGITFCEFVTAERRAATRGESGSAGFGGAGIADAGWTPSVRALARWYAA
jgi:hypothetical protein